MVLLHYVEIILTKSWNMSVPQLTVFSSLLGKYTHDLTLFTSAPSSPITYDGITFMPIEVPESPFIMSLTPRWQLKTSVINFLQPLLFLGYRLTPSPMAMGSGVPL